MTTYSTRSLYDWTDLRVRRWLAVLAGGGIFVPTGVFYLLYVRRFVIPVLTSGAPVPDPGWQSLILILSIIGDATVVPLVYSWLPRPATEFLIDNSGVTFRYENGRAWSLPWDSPRFGLKFARVPDGRYELPHAEVLSYFRPANRISIEAADELVRVARDMGLLVRERKVSVGTPPSSYLWISSRPDA